MSNYKRPFYKSIFLVLFLCTASGLFSAFRPQDGGTMDFYDFIGRFDVGSLWLPGRIVTDEPKDTFYKPEPLGYIGDDYQRFYIHFTGVLKSPDNNHQYLVSGKTMTKGVIHDFQGTILIKEAKLYNESESAEYRQGYITGEYDLQESPKDKNAGRLSGHFKSGYLLDDDYKVLYDALDLVADGYSNNLFEGIWVSYKDGTKKKCNWGDYRIPDSKPLDNGTGEFHVDEKYLHNGWESYMQALGSGALSADEVLRAQEKERKHWWE